MTVWAAQRGLRRPLGPSARLTRRHGEVERRDRAAHGEIGQRADAARRAKHRSQAGTWPRWRTRRVAAP
eukprot:5549685-Prymnesium_polylepis.1